MKQLTLAPEQYPFVPYVLLTGLVPSTIVRRMNTHPCQPCPAGSHTYDEYGNSLCNIETASEPCATFTSAGFGPEGDWEHSFFCSACGWEQAEHITADDEA